MDNFLPAFERVQQTSMDKHVDVQFENIRKDIQTKRNDHEVVADSNRQVHQNYLNNVANQSETI
ncbi:MAG: hypothetical protein SOS22_01955 [Absicoccus sp.]|nr:hypothetical protein [Absicoccus sp.]MDY3034968.1 hypothetical protein [Absicoccus sp.]